MVFAPKFKSFCEGAKMEPYDPRKYPTWYNRHKEFNIEDVFEKEIEMSNSEDSKSIFDCNLNINNELENVNYHHFLQNLVPMSSPLPSDPPETSELKVLLIQIKIF